MEEKRLQDINIELIDPNPDNPRLIFRQEEMDNLLVSIKRYGVQVPISVFKDGKRYTLIDGERRWRTCKKLNFKTIPAIIQNKPTELANLLMMFNIHSLREQWDLFTIGTKISNVISLLTFEIGHEPNEAELSEETGLTRSTIRRCKLLIELPQKYKNIIFKELEKPKSKQRFTEDFFIEMESALKTVRRNHPEIINESKSNDIRDCLIEKYKNNVISNIVDFRKISKIATSYKNVGFSKQAAQKELERIFSENDIGISEVYNSTVGALYDEKKIVSSFNVVLYYINHLRSANNVDKSIMSSLVEIKKAIDKILGE